MTIFLNLVFLPVLIFSLRVLNNAIGTIRVIAMTDSNKVLGFALASLESLLFAYTASMVITDIGNISNLTAYVLGFAVGGYVGMQIENRYLNVYSIVDIICEVEIAHKIAIQLRDKGHGVTEMHGEGALGHVCQLRVVAHHGDVKSVIELARKIKPNCFITVEESRFIRGGWIRNQQQHER